MKSKMSKKERKEREAFATARLAEDKIKLKKLASDLSNIFIPDVRIDTFPIIARIQMNIESMTKYILNESKNL